MALLIKLTNAEYQFVVDTLDGARAEFEELIKEEDWYVTEMNERCKAAHEIMLHVEQQEVEDSENHILSIR